MVGSGARDIVRLEVPQAGALVASVGDWVVPARPVDPAGWEVVARAPGSPDELTRGVSQP
jgi:hypothetical protein